MEDRSKRAETTRPQVGERREKRRECDSVLSATNDESGDELNGETDDEDREVGEMGFDDGSAQGSHDHTSTLQIMVQILRDGARCERAAQEIRCSRRLGRDPMCQRTTGFLERGNPRIV